MRQRRRDGLDELSEATVKPPAGGDGPHDSARSGKNPAAVALGRLGGRKGGPARAAKLTAQQRRESARKAARARWSKERPSGTRTGKEGE